jgi:hypothetical protein
MGKRRDQIVEALTKLGGDATYSQLYAEIEKLVGKPLSNGQRAGIRREIENHSSNSQNWDGMREDLFRSIGGIGSGHWGLR